MSGKAVRALSRSSFQATFILVVADCPFTIDPIVDYVLVNLGKGLPAVTMVTGGY